MRCVGARRRGSCRAVATDGEADDAQNGASGLRRACSLSDLSKSSPRRLLPSPPNNGIYGWFSCRLFKFSRLYSSIRWISVRIPFFGVLLCFLFVCFMASLLEFEKMFFFLIVLSRNYSQLNKSKVYCNFLLSFTELFFLLLILVSACFSVQTNRSNPALQLKHSRHRLKKLVSLFKFSPSTSDVA